MRYAAKILPALLLLAACVQPTTQGQYVTPEELEQERRAQEDFLRQNRKHGQYRDAIFSSRDYDSMSIRLQRVLSRINPAAATLCFDIQGEGGHCNLRVELSPEAEGLNAHADGKKVVLSPEMVNFAKSDTHLAFVIAHEYSHNIMEHVAAAQKNVALGAGVGILADILASSQGMDTGGKFTEIGAQAGMLRYSPAFENEADYVGLYILARAGYPIEDAPDFWRQMSIENPDALYVRSTHPTNPERFIAMRKTIDEIKAKQKQKLPLLPQFKPKH